jgi:hypothetical protein
MVVAGSADALSSSRSRGATDPSSSIAAGARAKATGTARARPRISNRCASNAGVPGRASSCRSSEMARAQRSTATSCGAADAVARLDSGVGSAEGSRELQDRSPQSRTPQRRVARQRRMQRLLPLPATDTLQSSRIFIRTPGLGPGARGDARWRLTSGRPPSSVAGENGRQFAAEVVPASFCATSSRYA